MSNVGGATAADVADPVAASEALLDAVRRGEDTDTHLARLEALDDAALKRVRQDADAANAFWANLYNAGTQLLLDRRPGLYESPLRTLRFFRATAVRVSGTALSLDDIEHGILRGSRSKYGLGYLPRLTSSGFVRRYALDSPDPRIHFALNCGAASCPAIRAYEPELVDEQLDLATSTYLDSTVEYDAEDRVVEVPRLFLWYRGDFGGSDGIRRLLDDHGVIPPAASPRVRHRSWDWTLAPGKYADA